MLPESHTPCDLCGGSMDLMTNKQYECDACGWSRPVNAGDYMDQETRIVCEQIKTSSRTVKIIHVAETQEEWRRIVEASRRRRTNRQSDEVPF